MNAPTRNILGAWTIAALAGGLPAIGSGEAGGVSDGMRVVYTDAPGDAVLRRTDPTLTAPVPSALPDLLGLSVGGWSTPTPASDPYSGQWVAGAGADLLRIDLVVDGVANPPGTLSPFNPTQFGQRPLIAFVELDADDDKNTGGECDEVDASRRYLGAVARFGALPYGSIAERAARNASELSDGFGAGPEVELTGAEFVLILCGCSSTTVVERFGDPTPNTFDEGDEWIISGRFFQRAGGYNGDASAIFGGTAPGEFDPLVRVRFRHDVGTDETTVSLVFPLTMLGAALLTGQPEQAPNNLIGGASHTSVLEAFLDIVDSVDFANPGCQDELMRRWDDDEIPNAMDPSRWGARALLGVPYLAQQANPYAYTDVGFRESIADLDADENVGPTDENAFLMWLGANDGGPNDADGVVNGAFGVIGFGPNFQLHDFNNDGVVDANDASVFSNSAPCPGDTNADNQVNFTDLNAALSAFGQAGAPGFVSADLNGDGVVDFADLNAVLSAFGSSCP
jgi:hypothetical protein